MNKTTFFAKKEEMTNRKWWVIDAKDQVLGAVALHASNILRGKTKPTFTPNVDTGDFVIVLNAKDVVLTGKKEQQKTYVSVSGYVGSKKVQTVEQVRAKHPEMLIEHAVKGMVPHNRLGRAILKKLKIYAGSEHPHQANQPEPYTIA
ncbi:MAG: 50S ribosomal protein L13 [Verrucomicrobiaceae bacterium]|jgi:large subunit ribosomal protein L13